jgi:alpha-D-xyloside xylohydrolase
LSFDDAAGRLQIGKRIGTFRGMADERQIHVRWIDGPAGDAADFEASPDVTVSYTGAAITIPFSR